MLTEKCYHIEFKRLNLIYPISTRSRVHFSLRFGLSLAEISAGAPGSQQPDIEPVFGQWAVTTTPPGSSTSARNRW